jgi:hypothetical protein
MASKQIVSIFYIYFFFIVIVIAISRVFRGGKDADVNLPYNPPCFYGKSSFYGFVLYEYVIQS